MSELDKIRENINKIDEKMAKLFEERMQEANKVAIYKKEYALQISDKEREKEVIKKNCKYIEDDVIREYYEMYQQSIMDISKQYQSRIINGMKVSYCGVEGAFAHIACKKIFKTATLVAYPSFEKAYNAVVNGEMDACVLPIENSFAGDVGQVMDLVFSGSLFINQIYDLEIVQNLIGKKDAKIEDIKTLMSHPQAFSQCSSYIEKNDYKTIDYPNTAIASMTLSKSNDLTMGVIASKETAELYDLVVLDSHINTSLNNTTRFAIFSRSLNKEKLKAKMGEHFILVFTVKNEAGALAKTLNIIGSHGFNMRNLRSRPMKELMWSYYFFIELEGKINTNDGAEMLNELQTVCDRLKLVGTYYINKI